MVHELTVEQADTLLEEKFLDPSTSPGTRRVSQGLMSPPTTNSVRSVSSSSSGSSSSVRLFPTKFATDAFFDLPIRVESVEGLQFIGFVESTAQKILQSWTSRPDPHINPDGLLEYILGHLTQQYLPEFKKLGLNPTQTMIKLGIKQEFIAAILAPEYECVFETQALGYWIKDTLRVQYYTLQDLLARLKILGQQAVNRKSKKVKLDIRDASKPQQSMPNPLSTATISEATEDGYLAQCIVLAHEPSLLHDHTRLYNGKASVDLHNSVTNPLIRENGEIYFGALETLPGGDFNSATSALYWTDDRRCAEIYRQYASRRNPQSETWIISIQVPSSLLSSLNIQTLNFSSVWKEYVWLCRNRTRANSMPIKFKNLSVDADIIKGHILFRLTRFVEAIHHDNIRAEIGEEHVMSVDGSRFN